MKNEKLYQEYRKEMEFLSNQLDSNEIMILGYLRGFDRRTMKEWQRKGLYD